MAPDQGLVADTAGGMAGWQKAGRTKSPQKVLDLISSGQTGIAL